MTLIRSRKTQPKAPSMLKLDEINERAAHLQLLLEQAIAKFDTLAPAQAAHRLLQRKSWFLGEFLFAHPNKTRADAEKVWEEVGQ